jgi:hypothetical protein
VAVAVALAVRAAVDSSAGWAAAAGGVAGLALLSTYGAPVALLIGVAAVVVVAARPIRVLGWAGAGVAVPLVGAAAAGFRWPDGLAATRDAYWDGIAAVRPAGYLTLAGNPGALALALGPAAAAGLWVAVARVRPNRARDRDRWVPAPALLPVSALVAVALADLSQMSRGEVERIWLPFVPWLALAAPGDRRGWLAAQAVVALTLQSTLASAW